MQFLKWTLSLLVGTAATVFAIGAWLIAASIGAIIGTISLGTGVLLLVTLVVKSWWEDRK